MGYKQLIINPGSTSTKLALYEDKEKIVQENVEHDAAQMQQFDSIADQIPFRMGIIRDFMARNSIQEKDLSAVMGRGGLVFGLSCRSTLAMWWSVGSVSRVMCGRYGLQRLLVELG